MYRGFSKLFREEDRPALADDAVQVLLPGDSNVNVAPAENVQFYPINENFNSELDVFSIRESIACSLIAAEENVTRLQELTTGCIEKVKNNIVDGILKHNLDGKHSNTVERNSECEERITKSDFCNKEKVHITTKDRHVKAAKNNPSNDRAPSTLPSLRVVRLQSATEPNPADVLFDFKEDK